MCGTVGSMQKGLPSAHCGAIAQLVPKLAVIIGAGKHSGAALKVSFQRVEVQSVIWTFILLLFKR